MSPRAALRIGRALRHRNYRLFFFGQGVSVIGTWIAALLFRRALPGLRVLSRPIYVRLGLHGEESA